MTPDPEDILNAGSLWEHTGEQRPPFAREPGPGQESVWDYPRPPALDPDDRPVRVVAGDIVIAESRSAIRVLETASPPTFYLPPDDVNRDLLRRARGSSHCEWKGEATYWRLDDRAAASQAIGWSYERPEPRFAAIAGFLSFYPGRVACFVDDERVRPQAGGFYGGWVTDEIVGPYKGEPGTGAW